MIERFTAWADRCGVLLRQQDGTLGEWADELDELARAIGELPAFERQQLADVLGPMESFIRRQQVLASAMRRIINVIEKPANV